MKVKAFILLSLMATQAGAISSTEPWLFGTLPYETTPFKEANLSYALDLDSPEGGPQALGMQALQTQAGLWEGLGLTLEGGLDTERMKGSLERALLQLRWPRADYLFLDVGLMAGWTREPFMRETASGFTGVIFSKEALDQAFCVNGLYDQNLNWALRAAFRSSFLFTGVRMGLEGEWTKDDFLYSPQASCDLPADIVLTAGARLDPDRPGAWQARLRLSAQIFGGW